MGAWVNAQSPAPSANATSALDRIYVGVSAENNSQGNTLAGGRAHPQDYGGSRSCRDFHIPAKLTITNHLAQVRWINYMIEGQITPQSALTMTTGYGHRLDGRIED